MTNTWNPASTPCLQQSQGKGFLRHVVQKLLCGGTFAIVWLHHGVWASSRLCHVFHFHAEHQASDPKHRPGGSLQASCQSVLQERNLTHSYHLRPFYLKNQWAFKNSPAHISFSAMVVNCFVLWFCGLLREPCFSAYDDMSIGKRKLTAFTLPLEKNEKALWGLQTYKRCKESKKPSKQKVNAFSTCTLHGGRISCPAGTGFTRSSQGTKHGVACLPVHLLEASAFLHWASHLSINTWCVCTKLHAYSYMHVHPHGPRESFRGFMFICISTQLLEAGENSCFQMVSVRVINYIGCESKGRNTLLYVSQNRLVWQVKGLGFAGFWFLFWLSSVMVISSLGPIRHTRKEDQETVKVFIDGYWGVSCRAENHCDFLAPSHLPIRPVSLEGETIKPEHPNGDICTK